MQQKRWEKFVKYFDYFQIFSGCDYNIVVDGEREF